MSASRTRVLVLGGYGVFGGRLVELLGECERLDVIVAGRSRDKADQFCASLTTDCRLEPAAVDRDGDIGGALDALAPDILIDASGPFQAYGERPYHVVEAALPRGIHYLDLADSAAFVCGISRFDRAAKAAGVFVLSGLSTCPALTAAAVHELFPDLESVDSIAAGIAPSPAADVGASVIRAVASYAGQAMSVIVDGEPARRHALMDHRDVTVGVPGELPLYRRRFSLVDVPDLELLRDVYPGASDIWVGAAIAPPTLHRVLNTMAALVRWRLLPSLLPFAALMHRISNRLAWGEHRGGMFVTVTGRGPSSESVQRSWQLTANGARGPYIPAIAAAAVVRRVSAGESPAAGARPATREISMKDFNRYFASLGIRTGVREQASGSKASLYQRVLGDAWFQLPETLRTLHGEFSTTPDPVEVPTTKWRGRARVTRGGGVLAKLVCSVFGFPPASDDVDVTVEFQRKQGRETWVRDFAGSRFSSVQYAGRGAYEGLLCERFGPFRFGLGTVVEEGVLHLPIRRWDCLGLRLPLWLAPGSNTREFESDGRFRFRVDLSLPVIGPLVCYDGYFDEELSASTTDRAPNFARAR